MTTENQQEPIIEEISSGDTGGKFTDKHEQEPPPKQEDGLNRLVGAIVDPKDLLHKLEMSDMPKGRPAGRIVLFLAQTRILKEMVEREKAKKDKIPRKRIPFGEILLDSLATVSRGQGRQLIDETIQLRAIDAKNEGSGITPMSGGG